MAQIKGNAHKELEFLSFSLPSPDRWYHKLFRIVLLLLVVIVTFFIIKQIAGIQKTSKSQELFVQYYEPYQLNYQVRSIETGKTELEQAYLGYDKKNYTQAIELFEKVMNSDNTLLFYKGISNLECGETNSAVQILEESLKSSKNMYCSQTHWYLSLAFLKLNQPGKARQHLLWLLNNMESGNFYRINASAVLNQLK